MTDPADQFRRFHQWISRHLVALCAVYHHVDDDGNMVKGPFLYVASGFVMSFRDSWSLVTAGHVIKEDIEADLLGQPHIRVEDVFLIDFFGLEAQHRNTVPFNLDGRPRIGVCEEDEGLDFGFISISPNERRLLEQNGIVAVEESNWLRQHEVTDFVSFMMLGIPAELVETKIGRTVTGQATIGSPGSVLLHVSALGDDDPRVNKTPYPRFVGEIQGHHNLSSIRGMSGGPIFGFATRDGRLYYWVVAVQSSVDKRDKRIVYACPLRIFGPQMLDALALADQLSTCTDDEDHPGDDSFRKQE